ncbi:MAG: DUF4838 domain-containing protein [Fermentimonas sp.]
MEKRINAKPAKNVNLMFCSIESNRSKPIRDDESSASFREDMEDWAELSDNIILWDYMVQFSNLYTPFPNFRVLQPNMQYFVSNNVSALYSQGNPQPTGDMWQLRAYVAAKLLWNPDCDLGLRAKGMVLTGAGQPIVLCAIDWIGIANESQDVFKQALAEAAGTVPERVAVHTLHQHDAPICDFTAEKILKAQDMPPGCFDGTFAREVIREIQESIRAAATEAQPVTHIGLGKAEVYRVASNRRILGSDGKVCASRSSSCKDLLLRTLPEGVIDPEVSLVSFWNDEQPVTVLSFYVTHPRSYYLTRIVNPDFPGIARFTRQLAVLDALHIHFNGAGGNVAAGKYNDGSHETRLVLAERLADGMKRAWENTRKTGVTGDQINWETRSIALPPANGLEEEIEKRMKDEDISFNYLPNKMGQLGWLKRRQEGKKNEIGCLSVGDAKILFAPGELFVEYQLAAKAMRPDLFVTMAAYGDYGPLYIGTEVSYA